MLQAHTTVSRIDYFQDGGVESVMTHSDPPPAPTPAQVVPGEQQRVWHSETLLGDQAEAIILHQGKPYRLRRTKQGKLILYK